MWADTSPEWDDVLAGSLSVICSASVLLGGEVVLADLPISDDSELTKSFDGRQITQSLKIRTVDDTGVFQTGPRAPLMPLGQQIVLRAGLADKANQPKYAELIPMGTFGVDSPDAQSDVPWKLYPGYGWVVTGNEFLVDASDPLAQVAREDFDALERPPIGATVRSETERLLTDRMPVAATWGTGVNAATAVPRQTTYDDSRLTTLLNLAQMANGIPWANRGGAYELLRPGRQSTGVWTLKVGNPDDPDDHGALVSWKPSMTREGLGNAWIITSEDTYGNQLRGVAYEDSGPLAWGGPFGRVPIKEENKLARSNAACQQLAQQRKQRAIDSRSITVRVTCLPNFALDPLDTIALGIPGRTIFGLITYISYPLGQRKMEMDVSIPFTDWVVR